MNAKELKHSLFFAWEPISNPDNGSYHIYDRLISTDEIRVIPNDDYLCGLKVSDFKELKNFTVIEQQTGVNSALHNALCSQCKLKLESQFSLILQYR